jgi:hypothetical protein
MTDESILYIEVPYVDRIVYNKNSFLELTYEHINFLIKHH